MKKYISLFAILVGLALSGHSQMEIKVHFTNVQCDTVRMQQFTDKHKLADKYVMPFSTDITFRDKEALEPGIYWILKDSTLLDAFFISSKKNQKFSISIDGEKGSVYQGSLENTHNQSYLEQMDVFNNRMEEINNKFNQARSTMPQYMLKIVADSCTAQANRLQQEKERYQRKVMTENPGTLLASIIQASIEMPQPPAEYYNDRARFFRYYMEHYFDNYPWNDPRIFNTPVGDNKIKEFCNTVYQLDDPSLDTCIIMALNASKVNETSFYKFFDRLESIIGSNVSPYKVEHSYIRMLQNGLTYPNLEENHKRRWTRELKTINKNLDGSIAPNFNIVLSTGDTTTLYDIQSEYLILYLQHPTCPTCHEVRGRMANYPILNNAIARGRINVLTVYFEDDAKVWENFKKANNANPSWMHSWNYDQSIEQDELYDTRTIPYMFLLDKDKRIIRKDILVNEVEDYIKKLGIVE